MSLKITVPTKRNDQMIVDADTNIAFQTLYFNKLQKDYIKLYITHKFKKIPLTYTTYI